MKNRRTTVLQAFKITSSPTVLLLPLLLFVLSSAEAAKAQARGFPGPAARENNRSMDEYDRTINRMKNDSKASKERRLNLFPQINEDFQRMQVIHNEIVRMLQGDKGFNYDRLVDLTDEMKRRGTRLRSNLALPEPEKTGPQSTHSESIDESRMKKTIVQLHDLIVSFVANPLFKNLGVVSPQDIDKASDNLDEIIDTSDEIKKEAKVLSKMVRN